MRTRATVSGIFASVAILVIGWQAGSAAVTAAHTTSTGTTSSTTTAGAGMSTGSTVATPAPAASGSTSQASGSYTGSSVNTQFGSVQVQIVVVRGKITDVKALHLTDSGGRSVQISNYAAPILTSEVLSSQSAQVSTVGGATYTSEAYLTSLQSALDQAGI